jgi:hypothetical protein
MVAFGFTEQDLLGVNTPLVVAETLAARKKHKDPAPSPEGGQHAMPFCDAYISERALSPSAERELLGRITDLLLEQEGVDPTNEMGRRLAWVFVHRHEMYVAGEPAQATHYRFVCHVPEGQYNDERRAERGRSLRQNAMRLTRAQLATGSELGLGLVTHRLTNREGRSAHPRRSST